MQPVRGAEALAALAEAPGSLANGELCVRFGPGAVAFGRRPPDFRSGSDLPDRENHWNAMRPDVSSGLSRRVWDGHDQVVLPEWNRVKLSIGGRVWDGSPGGDDRTRLDLRSGEADAACVWGDAPGGAARIHATLLVPRGDVSVGVATVRVDRDAEVTLGLDPAASAGWACGFEAEASGRCLAAAFHTRDAGLRYAQALRWTGGDGGVGARAYAAASGEPGARFPYMATPAGDDATGDLYKPAVWMGVCVVLGQRDRWRASGRRGDLAELHRLASELARFYCARVREEADGRFHLRGVLGPNEAVAESGPGSCDDNTFTNVGVRRVLEWATEAAEQLGRAPDPRWADVAARLRLPGPDAGGVLPESADDDGRATLKQADLLLALNPLGWLPEGADLLANVEHHAGRVNPTGPLMSTQIEALLRMKAGDRDAGLRVLFEGFERYLRGPLRVPFETPNPANGNAVFLTGVGGLLQALTEGWHGATPGDADGLPRVGDGWPTE